MNPPSGSNDRDPLRTSVIMAPAARRNEESSEPSIDTILLEPALTELSSKRNPSEPREIRSRFAPIETDREIIPLTPEADQSHSDFLLLNIPSPVSLTRTPAPEFAPRVDFEIPAPPRSEFFLCRALRSVLFLRPRDTVQVSIFGPSALKPGTSAVLNVYTHPTETFKSVQTLARASRRDCSLIAVGYSSFVPRGLDLSLHLEIEGAGVSNPNMCISWLAQTSSLSFEVFVPWECPAGRTTAFLTQSLKGTPIARLAFDLNVRSS